MNTIHDMIARARRRLWLLESRSTVLWSLAIVGVALVALRGAQKLAPALELPWFEILIGAPIAAALAGMVWAWRRVPDQLGAARVVDEGAALRETLSTACVIETNDDAWSRAVIDDARDKASRINLRAAIPMTTPRWWHAPILATLALLAVWWLPTRDLTGALERQRIEREQQAQVDEVRSTVESANEKMKEIARRTGIDIDMSDLDPSEDLLNPERSEYIEPEESLRSAIKNLTAVSDELEKKREGEDAETLDALRDAMESLENNRDDPASEMARAMARGDFGEAKKKLDELAKQLDEGAMSEEQREQAAKQLEALREQLEQAAANDKELKEQLEKAGLSEQEARRLASDPDALEKKLREQGVPASQAKSLAQAARSQQRAGDAAAAMSQAMGQMAKGMEQGDQQQASEGAQAMGEQLSQLEQMQSEMDALEHAMSDCKSQLDALSQCSNPGGNAGSESDQGGNGRGGIRAGRGGVPNLGEPSDPNADYLLSREKAKVRVNQGGPVIASTLVYGSQIRGESSAAFASAVESASTQASEAIETRRVPRAYEAAVQRYFGRLDQAAKGEDAPKADGERTKGETSGPDDAG